MIKVNILPWMKCQPDKYTGEERTVENRREQQRTGENRREQQRPGENSRENERIGENSREQEGTVENKREQKRTAENTAVVPCQQPGYLLTHHREMCVQDIVCMCVRKGGGGGRKTVKD